MQLIFKIHDDISCSVCSTLEPSKRSNKLHLKSLDTLMENNGFMKVPKCAEGIKRIYLYSNITSNM